MFYSKVTYDIELCDAMSKNLINRVNSKIFKAARLVIGNRAIGRTNEQVLKIIGWKNVEDQYFESTGKLIHKVMNTGFPEYFHELFSQNRTGNDIFEGKPYQPEQAAYVTRITRNQFSYIARQAYRQLPAGLTCLSKQT